MLSEYVGRVIRPMVCAKNQLVTRVCTVVLLQFLCGWFGISAAIAQSWTLGTAPYGRHLNDVAIMANGDIFVAGGHPSNDAISSIFITRDLGISWDIQVDLLQPWTKAIAFADQSIGVAVGVEGRIRRTTDAGALWQEINSGFTENLNDICFSDPTNGYIVGGNAGTGATQLILKSTNGGSSWSSQLNQSGQPLYGVTFLNSSIGFAVGAQGTILKTTNAGVSWNVVPSPVVRDFNAVEFTDPLNGFIVGGKFSADSIRTILSTSDGGQTWTVALDEAGGWLTDIDFIDSNNGYAVGDVGTVLRTTNAGANWTGINLPGASSSDRFQAVEMTSSTSGIIVGYWGVTYILQNFPMPLVQTLSAVVQPSQTAAQLQATVNTGGTPGQATFLLSTDPAMISYSEFQTQNVNSTQPQFVQQLATQLVQGETYYYCAKATTVAGVSYGDTLSFVAVIPFQQLSMDSILNEESQLPVFHGTVSGFVEQAQLFFEYGTTANLGMQVTANPSSVSTNATLLPSYVFGQSLPSGEYFVRMKAVAASGTYYSELQSFYCGQPFDQFVAISATYDILTDAAQLVAQVANARVPLNLQFSYWGGSSGTVSASPATISDTLNYTVLGQIVGLVPNSNYTVQLSAFTPYGFHNSNAISFFTGVNYDNFTTNTATEITPTTAILNGWVNGLNYDSEIEFEYGTTTQLAQTITASPATITDGDPHDIQAQLQSLIPNTLYYYRLKGTAGGNTFYGELRQFFTGPPEIPNWDFQSWDHRVIELPVGWNIIDESFERIDLGSGNSALKLTGGNATVMGYFTNSQGGGPDFHGVIPFSYRPDSIFVVMNHFVEPEDTTTIMVKLENSNEVVSFGFYPIVGSSNGSFQEMAIPLTYLTSGTPELISIALINFNMSHDAVFTSSNMFSVDRIHFGPNIPSLPELEFDNWNSFEYDRLNGWSYDKFLNNASGNLSEPMAAMPLVYNGEDTAVIFRNFETFDDIVESQIYTGETVFGENEFFTIDRRHEVLTGWMKFEHEGTDTLSLRVDFMANGQFSGSVSLMLHETISDWTPFDLPIQHYQFEPEPDSARIEIRIINHDNSSLSVFYLDKLCFDGFYVGQSNVVIGLEDNGLKTKSKAYPNPTSGILHFDGLPDGSVIEVFDLNGRLVRTPDLASGNFSIDLSSLIPGVYLARVKDLDSHFTQRIVVIGQVE